MSNPCAIYLKDYLPPPYTVEHYELSIKLFDTHAEVSAALTVVKNSVAAAAAPTPAPLRLDGEHLTLKSVIVDGVTLKPGDYTMDEEGLTIPSVPDRCVVKTVVHIHPHLNSALSGLYCSENNYCTQCESHGFRRICYAIDRPDVLATFRTTIEADAVRFPQLLANGNPVKREAVGSDRHAVTWENPFPMPCYLFAMVAGDMALQQDTFITASGRQIDLQLYLEKHNAGKGDYALQALKAAMRWDEVTYGREYDLDIYMIVAVSTFNMGAMENKGLNIFNDKYILADKKTATDLDYQYIFQVVGHEYFHNWSGNRVTLRDWFQLSLKEGFTVFREQSFAADHASAAICRIEDVRALKNAQFTEDASPMAHPVRPESYVEMNNFYTATVYEKGAELIRMLQTLLGPATFRKACDQYFERFDGQAATTDDFVSIMAAESGLDLTQFKRWYSQSGTPVVGVNWVYHDEQQTLELQLTQHTDPTPDQDDKEALHIPIRMALLGPQGQPLTFALPDGQAGVESVYSLRESKQTLMIKDIPERPIPSLFRGFSAPVKTDIHYTPEEWVFLAVHDTDPVARHEAVTQLMVQELFHGMEQGLHEGLSPRMSHVIASILNDEKADLSLTAHLLTLPSEHYFAQIKTPVRVDDIVRQRQKMIQMIGHHFYIPLELLYNAVKQDSYTLDQHARAKRMLRSVALGYMVASGEPQALDIATEHYFKAHNMSDRLGALRALNDTDCVQREQLLQDFYGQWEDNALVIDKWLTMQATSRLRGTIERVKTLTEHPAFSFMIPNKVYSLLSSFGHHNFAQFHAKDGSGYRLIEEAVLILNNINPQVAARVIKPLISFERYELMPAEKMRASIERIAAHPNLAKDLYEIVSKTLEQTHEKTVTQAAMSR